jgi:hypothetical protein
MPLHCGASPLVRQGEAFGMERVRDCRKADQMLRPYGWRFGAATLSRSESSDQLAGLFRVYWRARSSSPASRMMCSY